jgi:hypothetical protein
MTIDQKVANPKEKKSLDKKIRDNPAPKQQMAEKIPEALNEDYKSEDYKVVEENLTCTKAEPGTKRTGFHPSTR